MKISNLKSIRFARADVIETKEAWENQYEKIQETVRQELQNHYRPKFLNRINDIVLFRNLTQGQILGIVDVQMKGLHARLAEKNMSIALSDKAKELLSQKGYDPVFSARPLKRALQKIYSGPPFP